MHVGVLQTFMSWSVVHCTRTGVIALAIREVTGFSNSFLNYQMRENNSERLRNVCIK